MRLCLSRPALFFAWILLPCLFATSCRYQAAKGVLHISAPSAGSYEIYSIAGDATLQFVSEQVGHFNKDLQLSVGSYLILADCSHRTITIHPDERTELVAHVVHFVPPHTPVEGDLFSIQCSRYEKSHLKQQITNRFTFHMVSAAKDLLVGMLPLKIDFPEGSPPPSRQGQTLSFELSALQVEPAAAEAAASAQAETPYFVSPKHDLLSITQAQQMGKWQFLLPGEYRVFINGTETQVSLQAAEAHVISPAGLKITTASQVDLDLITQIQGYPFTAELNNRHALDLNTFYPMLPGQAKLRFAGSAHFSMLDLVAQQVVEIPTKSILIDSGCSYWEWECLGKNEVSLYLPNQQYPFLESISDIPILYVEDKIEVSLESSIGIRYRVPNNTPLARVKIGKIQIIPILTHKPYHVTDLLRLEASSADLLGYSRDIVSDRITTLTVIADTYNLAKYTALLPDGERMAQKQSVVVKPGEVTTVEVPYFVPESKIRAQGKTLVQKKRGFEKKLTTYDRKHSKHFKPLRVL